MYFQIFLKVAVEGAEQIDSRRLFLGEGVQEQNALAPVLVFTLGTDRVILLWDLNEWDERDVGSIVCR